MFVLKSTYEKLERKYDMLYNEHAWLTDKWNSLVRRINAKGGESFLGGHHRQNHQLSDEDIKRLLFLCHPDKHGGKKMAEEMTQKLLELRS